MILYDSEKERVRFIVPNYLNLSKVPRSIVSWNV